jgi:hypothetical protein
MGELSMNRKRSATINVASLGLELLVSTNSAIANDAYVAESDADVKIQCRCVLATAACQSKIFDAIGGKERLE